MVVRIPSNRIGVTVIVQRSCTAPSNGTLGAGEMVSGTSADEPSVADTSAPPAVTDTIGRGRFNWSSSVSDTDIP